MHQRLGLGFLGLAAACALLAGCTESTPPSAPSPGPHYGPGDCCAFGPLFGGGWLGPSPWLTFLVLSFFTLLVAGPALLLALGAGLSARRPDVVRAASLGLVGDGAALLVVGVLAEAAWLALLGAGLLGVGYAGLVSRFAAAPDSHPAARVVADAPAAAQGPASRPR